MGVMARLSSTATEGGAVRGAVADGGAAIEEGAVLGGATADGAAQDCGVEGRDTDGRVARLWSHAGSVCGSS